MRQATELKMANVPKITLNNGIKMPAFGLGTYRVNTHIYVQIINGIVYFFR